MAQFENMLYIITLKPANGNNHKSLKYFRFGVFFQESHWNSKNRRGRKWRGKCFWYYGPVKRKRDRPAGPEVRGGFNGNRPEALNASIYFNIAEYNISGFVTDFLALLDHPGDTSSFEHIVLSSFFNFRRIAYKANFILFIYFRIFWGGLIVVLHI